MAQAARRVDMNVTTEQMDQQTLGRELERTLCDLLALALNAKQAHWHVTGRHFSSVHAQLDAIVDDARAYADQVAERAITMGIIVDGRPEAVAKTTTIDPIPDGWLRDEDVVRLMVERLETAIHHMRENLEAIGAFDLVTQGLLIDIVGALEKHAWMLQAQRA